MQAEFLTGLLVTPPPLPPLPPPPLHLSLHRMSWLHIRQIMKNHAPDAHPHRAAALPGNNGARKSSCSALARPFSPTGPSDVTASPAI